MGEHTKEAINAARQKGEARLKRIWDQVRWDEETNQITFATNEAEEGLLDAYFAVRKEEEVPIEGAAVEVRRETYVARSGYYISTFAAEHGIDNWRDLADANKDVLPDPNNPPAEVELIIPNSEEIPTEIVVSYVPVKSVTLGNDTYIVVKGFALKEKWATIQVFEKEPYLLMEAEDTPVTFLEYASLDPEGDDLINENQTEFKAQFNDQGEAIVKIQLRPKKPDDENEEDSVYVDWQKKFEPIVETTENEVTAVETSIRPIARPENLDTTVNPTDHSSFKIIDYLFLKVIVNGDQDSYELHFPEVGGQYFELTLGCACSGYYLEDGWLYGPNVVHEIPTETNVRVKGTSRQEYEGIVLHRTTGGTTASAARQTAGTNFYVDGPRGVDGQIYQAFQLSQITSHIRSPSSGLRTDRHELIDANSIGIEVAGYHYTYNNNNILEDDYGQINRDPNSVTKAYSDGSTNHYWDKLSKKQVCSTVCIINSLLKEYNITKQNIVAHDEIQVKTAGEGLSVMDAISSYL